MLWRAVVFAVPAGAVIWLVANVTVGGREPRRALRSRWLDPFGLLLGLNGVILLAYIVAIPANEIVIPTVLMLTVLTTGRVAGVGEGAGVMFETGIGRSDPATCCEPAAGRLLTGGEPDAVQPAATTRARRRSTRSTRRREARSGRPWRRCCRSRWASGSASSWRRCGGWWGEPNEPGRDTGPDPAARTTRPAGVALFGASRARLIIVRAVRFGGTRPRPPRPFPTGKANRARCLPGATSPRASSAFRPDRSLSCLDGT